MEEGNSWNSEQIFEARARANTRDLFKRSLILKNLPSNRKHADSISYIFLLVKLQIMNKLTLELFKLYVKMLSNPEFNLANTSSGLKEILPVSFPSLKRELSEEKRLRSTAL